MVAGEKGKQDVVTLLLERRADPAIKDADGATALDYAVTSGQTEIAKALFAKSAGSNKNYKSESELLAAVTNFALLSAASQTNLAQVKTQLDAGADVNCRNASGETPLIVAVAYGYGRNEVASLLIDKGADVNAADINGNTALMIARQIATTTSLLNCCSHTKRRRLPETRKGGQCCTSQRLVCIEKLLRHCLQ
jgi:ankyrin repeat protein